MDRQIYKFSDDEPKEGDLLAGNEVKFAANGSIAVRSMEMLQAYNFCYQTNNIFISSKFGEYNG